jgi:ABC-type antimicrobial peptide transport system permease subunit
VAIISILAGLGVLFSIVQQQASLRLRDHALMRAVGAKPKDLMLMGVLEILWLSSAAVIFGWTMSLAMSKLMAQVFFDGAWEPAFWGGLFQSLLMISVCVITGFLASWRSLKVSPVLSLRA